MNLKDIKMREILRFLVGGGSAVVVDFAVYCFLKGPVGLIAAKVISYIAGAIVGFIINKLWTFESKQFKLSEVGRYIILYAFSACANTAVNKCVLLLIPSTIFAFLCATGGSTVLNFLGQKFFVFRKQHNET